MRIQTKSFLVYKFKELDETGKSRALVDYAENGLDYEWYDHVKDFFKECLSTLGVEVRDAYFSGFYHQGSGASFSGNFIYREDWKANLEAICTGGKLHDACIEAGEALDAMQSRFMALPEGVRDYEEEISCSIHSSCNDYFNSASMSTSNEDCRVDDAEGMAQIFRELADTLYFILRDEYEYLTGEEAFSETAEANGWEFTKDGGLV